MFLLICMGVLTVLIYSKFIKPLYYWKQRGIIGLSPWPIVGNMGEYVLRHKSYAEVFDNAYKAFPGKRYLRFYQMTVPSLIIRDLDLIKKISVKEFETFPQHRAFVPEDVDPLWSKTLFAMRGGDKWQDMRSTLSPAFTKNKMKMLFTLMKKCSKQLSNHYLKQGSTITVELKDVFSKFSNDIVSTTALGITCDSLQHPDNALFIKAKELHNFSGIRGIIIIINALSPALSRILGLPLYNSSIRTFFGNLVKETVKTREEQETIRPDMFHLLMEARKVCQKAEDAVTDDSGFAVVQEPVLGKTRKRSIEITNDDMTAQVLVFYFAGTDSSSTMMSFTAYELAVNPEIQDKLRKEIDEVLDENNSELTYESLMGMKYLDKVVAESLRKWPPFVVHDRESVRPFTIEPENEREKPLYLEKGSVVLIPNFSIQRDPKYWPNPEKFDPERFNEENKHKILPCSYIPFGIGPRNCIGSRYALLQGKLAIVEIIGKFEIFPVGKTQIPVKLKKGCFTALPDNGVWLGMKPRIKIQ